MKQVPLEQAPSFLSLQDRVFQQAGTKVYLGGELISNEMRSALRDEAEFILRGRLWEILSASVFNEAYNMSLIQSKDWESVLDAKMLHHWGHFMRNVVTILARP